MNNNVELIVARTKEYGIPKETLLLMLSYMPDEELTPYAMQNEDIDHPFTLFGFATDSISDKLNDSNLDAFNALLLKEACYPIPVGKHKLIRLMNVNVIIMG